MRDMAERERGWNTQLTAATVIEIRRARARGERLSDIAERFGISKSNAGMICRNATWKHLPSAETFARLLEGGPDEVTF
jgi:transcriptional regulator